MEAAGFSTGSGTDVGNGLWCRAPFENEFRCTADHIAASGLSITRGTKQLSNTPKHRTFCISNIIAIRWASKGASTIRTVIISARLVSVKSIKWHGPEPASPNSRTLTAAASAIFETAEAVPTEPSSVHSAAPTGASTTADGDEKPANELAAVTGDAAATATQGITGSTQGTLRATDAAEGAAGLERTPSTNTEATENTAGTAATTAASATPSYTAKTCPCK